MPAGGDRATARRLQREAQSAARDQRRAERRYARAVERRERVLARARRALPVHGAVTAGSAAVVALGGLSDHWLVLTGVSAAALLRAGRRLHRPPALPDVPLALPRAAPPPPPGSRAWPLVRQLQAAREDLARLLPLVDPAGAEAAREAAAAAAAADAGLRWQAARLAAAEPHRGITAQELAALEDGVRRQEAVVTGLADLVAASADAADPFGRHRLREATDALHGLAAGLRAVRDASSGTPLDGPRLG